MRKLGRGRPGLAVLELVGGQPSRPQREALERGVHIAVGTPGRLLDHLSREALDTTAIQTVVLDEADRMLDMGFGEDVTRILRACPSERQTAMFSATFPDAIEAMSAKFQRDAVHVTMEEEEVELGAIRQLQFSAAPEEKFHALCFLLSEFSAESVLIFCNFKKTVVALTEDLAGAGLSVDRFDGDLDQFHRDQVLARFRNQSLRVLIATDVAGRGIDVEGLDLVVNFELPLQPEVYVHRIGRTGRAGKPGLALSLSSGPADPKTEAAEALTGTAIEFIDPEPFAASNLDSLLEKLRQAPRMETILISGGRKDKVRPGDIVGALTGDAGGLEGNQIGTIEVQDPTQSDPPCLSGDEVRALAALSRLSPSP
ncbi:MAG: helicase-related protein, partial [Planctomycetota bacterium]